MAIRQSHLLRLTGLGRLSWLCRSKPWDRLRLRDRPDGNSFDWRPAGRRVERSALFSSFGSAEHSPWETTRCLVSFFQSVQGGLFRDETHGRTRDAEHDIDIDRGGCARLAG